jgi:hypothetical protein
MIAVRMKIVSVRVFCWSSVMMCSWTRSIIFPSQADTCHVVVSSYNDDIPVVLLNATLEVKQSGDTGYKIAAVWPRAEVVLDFAARSIIFIIDIQALRLCIFT